MVLGRVPGYSLAVAMVPEDNHPQNHSCHPPLNKALLPPTSFLSWWLTIRLSVSSLSSLQENSLGMDGAIYVATALSENHGLHHIK